MAGVKCALPPLRGKVAREARRMRGWRRRTTKRDFCRAKIDALPIDLIVDAQSREPLIRRASPAAFPRTGGRRSRLQRAIPIRQVHIDVAHGDAVFAGVAHELRGRVEAERLAIEHGGAEDIGIAAFDPARGIDQQRETGGVALGKAIFAKALDLTKAPLGEVALIASRRHAFDHLGLEALDRADAPEGRHGAAQFIGFGGGEAGGDNGDFHRLFLKQWHAQRLAQDAFQLSRGVDDLLDALPAAQIGMHHIALNRAGADNGDFNDQVVEFGRLQARQHRHLRPTFDLKHADCIGALDHGIDASFLGRDRG